MSKLVMDKVYSLCRDVLDKKCAGMACPHGGFHNYNPKTKCGHGCENPYPYLPCPACISITPADAKILMGVR